MRQDNIKNKTRFRIKISDLVTKSVTSEGNSVTSLSTLPLSLLFFFFKNNLPCSQIPCEQVLWTYRIVPKLLLA